MNRQNRVSFENERSIDNPNETDRTAGKVNRRRLLALPCSCLQDLVAVTVTPQTRICW